MADFTVDLFSAYVLCKNVKAKTKTDKGTLITMLNI